MGHRTAIFFFHNQSSTRLGACQYCYYHNVVLTLLRFQYLYFCTRVKQVNSVFINQSSTRLGAYVYLLLLYYCFFYTCMYIYYCFTTAF
jgi:hypothetical protein